VVRGGAIGGGFELALACDFLVAAEDATFFAVEIRSGNIPLAGGLQRLAERVGRARAAKLALLGEPFSGITAGDLGIATLVVPEADLDETSRKLVDKLANGPTKAYAAARTILKAWSAGGISLFPRREHASARARGMTKLPGRGRLMTASAARNTLI
jgi:enoyl-CoA hydratase/carnithine racemase